MAKFSSIKSFSFVGKQVRDEYGRQIGRITSLMVSPNGHVNGIFIKRGDGKFLRYSSNQFKIRGDDVVFFPLIKLRARALCNEIPLISLRDQALGKLLGKKKISQETFNNLHKKFENALNRLKADAQASLDEISKQITKCVQQIRKFRSAMVYLELEYAIGKIDEKLYQMAMEKMQESLKRADAEKSDLEATGKKLSNILHGEEATAEAQAGMRKEALSAPPVLPEPPVEVHIKS